MMKWVLSVWTAVFVSAISFAAELGDVLWEFATEEPVVASPVIDSAGNVYFGSQDRYIYSVDSQGQQRWRFQTGDWVESSPALSPDETRIYIGTWDDRILAIDTSTGALDWEFQVASLVYASPAVAQDGTIYIGASDGFLYALNPNGSLKWDLEIGGELDSSPAIDADGNVYVGSSAGAIAAVTPSGSELWTWEVPLELGAIGRETDITSSPMLTSTGLVLVGSQNFFVYGLNATDGSLEWKYETGGIVEGSFVEGMGRSCLISGRDGYLYSFSWEGELNWKTFIGANYYSTPCVDGMGRIYAGALESSSSGSLTILSSNGEILRKTNFSGFVDSSPVLSPDGTLFVGNNDGKLYALQGGYKPASIGWARFRGGSAGRGSLQGYVDLTGMPGQLLVTAYAFDEADSVVANYRVEGGGPIEVEIKGLDPALLPRELMTGYDLSLVGEWGSMAFAEANQPVGDGEDGSIRSWLEPGEYVIELVNQTSERDALFLEVKVL